MGYFDQSHQPVYQSTEVPRTCGPVSEDPKEDFIEGESVCCFQNNRLDNKEMAKWRLSKVSEPQFYLRR